MNIKEVAQLTGLSHQAIYKKIKANGLVLSTLKDQATGHLTQDGEAKIRALFGLPETEEIPVAQNATELTTELTTKVAELTTEVEKLRNQVATMKAREEELTEERDFLRKTIERGETEKDARLSEQARTIENLIAALQQAQEATTRAQAINAATISALQPPAITDGTEQHRQSWWARIAQHFKSRSS